jgi:iron complex transport system substrate-binding protein
VRRLLRANAAAFAAALAASTFAVWVSRPHSPGDAQTEPREGAAAVPSAPANLIDSEGVPIPRRDYRRIVSVSPVADEILLEICEPDRLAAFTATSARSSQGFRYAGKPTIEQIDDLESILSLRPDLVLVNGVRDARPVARLREAGLIVFDLGEMRGLSTLTRTIRELAEILGCPERGERFATDVIEGMNAVAADVPPSERPRALYLSVYGDSLFGSALETSFHDVLLAAGLVDAAKNYRGWPQYTPEQVLAMDPEVIVTHEGMGRTLCRRPGLALLRACKTPDRIVEVDGEVFTHPGPSMVETARVIRAAVHGPPATPSFKIEPLTEFRR